MRKHLYSIFTFLALILGLMSLQPTLAQCDDPNDQLGVGCGAASGLGAGDPRAITARIINIILSLLGIIDVGLMLYAGFNWMTAGGNEEKITSAKGTIWASIIGLLIILSAYAISRFVLVRLYEATTNTRMLF